MKKTIAAISAVAALSACAQSPGAIAPSSMGNAYSGVSCKSARAMLSQEQQTFAALSSKQNSAVAGDAIGVFLIGVPVSSLAGGDVAGDIATSKGKINALNARLVTCG